MKYSTIPVSESQIDYSELGPEFEASRSRPNNPHNLSVDDVRYEYRNLVGLDIEKTLICRTPYHDVVGSPPNMRIRYWLTKQQAAEFCGVSEKTIQRHLSPDESKMRAAKIKTALYKDTVVFQLKENLDREREELAQLETIKAEKELKKAAALAELAAAELETAEALAEIARRKHTNQPSRSR